MFPRNTRSSPRPAASPARSHPPSINTNLPAAFHTALSYDANNVYLQILDLVIPGELNRNQQAVGDALTNYFNSNGGIPLVYGALSAGGLAQASGESATGARSRPHSRR